MKPRPWDGRNRNPAHFVTAWQTEYFRCKRLINRKPPFYFTAVECVLVIPGGPFAPHKKRNQEARKARHHSKRRRRPSWRWHGHAVVAVCVPACGTGSWTGTARPARRRCVHNRTTGLPKIRRRVAHVVGTPVGGRPVVSKADQI